MKEKIKYFIKSPELALFLFMAAMLGVLWAYGASVRSRYPGGNAQQVMNVVTTVSTTTSTTTTTTTSTTTTVTTTTTTTVTTTVQTTTAPEPEEPDEIAPGQPLSAYIYDGISPNSAFYQERMVIAGDSIATGFSLYGYIPGEHSIARESVGLWNYGGYTFDIGYGDMGMIDAIACIQPSLLYISMGMNDLPSRDPDWFAGIYYDLIMQILDAAPDVNIVAAGISPVQDFVSYSSNENICDYNAALENMVCSIDSPRVCYFDAYSVLADGNTLALSDVYSAGDGIHLASYSYNDILTALFNFLDTTPVMGNIMECEQ